MQVTKATTIALIFLTSMTFASAYSQPKGYLLGYKIEGNDTVYQIRIKDFYFFSRPAYRMKNKDWQEYYRLVYNFKKTYPFALIAKEKITEADSVISSSKFNAREREKYLRSFENELFKEFEKPMRKMTFSQGKLLLRLIDREIGQSSYYIIKSYRGNVNAVFWQGIARIFGSDLKQPYDRFGKDRETEELVRMYQNGTFDYLYYSLFD
ncbi:MAG: DUF4294 domain-containing protein [Bacteroidales bacterium]|jgi:hypothetical protein|nr:DUF4294 domain-containing protein [Bacteroidales bacterium]